jgi:hypothetical protein
MYPISLTSQPKAGIRTARADAAGEPAGTAAPHRRRPRATVPAGALARPAEVGAVIAALPGWLGDGMTEAGATRVGRAVAVELAEHRTAEQLLARVARRGADRPAEPVRDAVAYATAMVRGGPCPSPRCEDGTDIDTGDRCRLEACPGRTWRHRLGGQCHATHDGPADPSPVTSPPQTHREVVADLAATARRKQARRGVPSCGVCDPADPGRWVPSDPSDPDSAPRHCPACWPLLHHATGGHRQATA